MKGQPCEICTKPLILQQERFCSIPCRDQALATVNRNRDYGPSPLKGRKMSPEACARMKESRRHVPNSMKRPEVVAKVLATKKRTFDLRGRKGDIALRFKRLKAYRDWRLAVFERDDYRCFDCGERGGRLEAHHIYAFAKYPRLRLVMENGITLCRECHKKTPSYGNRQPGALHIVRSGDSSYS